MSEVHYTLGQLAELLGAECIGDSTASIVGLATLVSASAGHLSFLSNPRYIEAMKATQATAVLVSPDQVDDCSVNALVVANPYLAYAHASQLFTTTSSSKSGIHPDATVSDSASIDPTASISARCCIGDNVTIGANSVIEPGCVIGENSVLGSGCYLHANVTIYHEVIVGDRVAIHSGSVIGSDGFGYVPSPDPQGGWVKIAQLGGVRIGNDVEIGAGVTMDRGALDDTVIGDRLIIDNQVHIAHNVSIGDNTAVAGCVGIAGSTSIGKNCSVGGQSAFAGHITIADNVHFTGMSMVTKSVKEPGLYSSGTGLMESKKWRKSAVRFQQLDDISKRLTKLEKS